MKFWHASYPHDPAVKHHLLIALFLVCWIFGFLYLTQPLDVSEFSTKEQLIYLPLYGLLGGILYAAFIPLQKAMFQQGWSLGRELLFLVCFVFVTIVVLRFFYLYIVVPGEPNPYSFVYQLTAISLPAIATILPFVVIARYAFGRYTEKQLEKLKIDIQGEGSYDGLQLFLDDLIYIQSSDNYIEVFYKAGTENKKALIRNKLSVIDEQFPELLRVHRSYIINPLHFVRWKSEKGKLYIELSSSEFVPVSNSYKSVTKAVIHSTTNS